MTQSYKTSFWGKRCFCL